jgi:hypothetical protein
VAHQGRITWEGNKKERETEKETETERVRDSDRDRENGSCQGTNIFFESTYQ